MSGTLYWVQNTPLGGAAAPTKVATGTTIKASGHDPAGRETGRPMVRKHKWQR